MNNLERKYTQLLAEAYLYLSYSLLCRSLMRFDVR